MIRIGVVVPHEINEEICQFLEKEFTEIRPVPFAYASITDIPDIVSGQQSQCDAFLFLGNTARRYAEKVIPHTSEWVTIPRSTSALLRLLFRAEVAGYGMRIASDLDNKDFFRLALHEIGYSPKDTAVETIPFFPYSEGLLVKDAAKMEKLYREGKVDFCITIFYKVRNILRSKGIPVYILQPSFDDIRSGMQRLLLSHELHSQQSNRICAISIHIDLFKESLPGSNAYHMSMSHLDVTKRIFQFAQTIHGACVQQPPWDYLIFAPTNLLESQTEQYRTFPLLDTVSTGTAVTLSIGIGYGTMIDEAQYRAIKAMQHASALGGNTAFLMTPDLTTRVPIAKSMQKAQEKEERPIDEQFLYLSQKSGISLRIISSLYHACQEAGKCRFTSSELSDLVGVTPRTINRILNKLIDHHIAQDASRRFTGKTGRPSRVIELLFETKKRTKKVKSDDAIK